MPELRERRFPSFEAVRTNEVSLPFRSLVGSVEVPPSGVGKECLLADGLLVVAEP